MEFLYHAYKASVFWILPLLYVPSSSAGLTIWQKRHMRRAPRFWGPRVYSLLFFPNFFIPCFSARSKQCAKCGALKSPSPPENARDPKFKKRGPIKLGPNVFYSLFQCFSAGPQRAPRSPENVRPQNLKIEVPNSRARNCFLVSCFSAGSKQRGAPKSPRSLKAKPPNKKITRPQSLTEK